MASAGKGKAKGPRPKHVPERTCVACRASAAKRELVRIVRTPTGAVDIDQTGKQAGRGAYLCRARLCWELALKKGKLETALSVVLGADDRIKLEEFGQSLPDGREREFIN